MLTTTVGECKARGPGGLPEVAFCMPLMPFRKKTKSLQGDRLLVYQSTYSLALCLAPNLLDEGLESRPTLLAELLFQTKQFKLV